MSERFAIEILPAGPEQYDFLDCMLRIDREEDLDPRASGLCARMFAAGLVEKHDGKFSLTAGGIERCQSIQHWIAADRACEAVLARRRQVAGTQA